MVVEKARALEIAENARERGSAEGKLGLPFAEGERCVEPHASDCVLPALYDEWSLESADSKTRDGGNAGEGCEAASGAGERRDRACRHHCCHTESCACLISLAAPAEAAALAAVVLQEILCQIHFLAVRLANARL